MLLVVFQEQSDKHFHLIYFTKLKKCNKEKRNVEAQKDITNIAKAAKARKAAEAGKAAKARKDADADPAKNKFYIKYFSHYNS